MPSCLNRCSAVATREPSPLKILSLESVFIDLAPGFDFDIRRQTSDVDQALGIHDCLFVEGGDSGGKRADKSVKISIRQRPIHIAVELGQLAWDVVRA